MVSTEPNILIRKVKRTSAILLITVSSFVTSKIPKCVFELHSHILVVYPIPRLKIRSQTTNNVALTMSCTQEFNIKTASHETN